VEEDREGGKATIAQRRGSTNSELSVAQKRRNHRGNAYGILSRRVARLPDVASNLVMYFLMLTTGATLHIHGTTNIQTAK
jgi:hypothetical protein